MKEYKPGDTINIHGVDLLILDETEDTVFVLAYNLDIRTKFDSKNSEYENSELQKKTEEWLATTDFYPLPRNIKLNTADDVTVYNTVISTVAPLTFDEYRKYSSIIKPHIKNWFWLANKWSKNSTYLACVVYVDGKPSTSGYDNMNGSIVPAFILPKSALGNPLSSFSTKDLLDEISRRNLF